MKDMTTNEFLSLSLKYAYEQTDIEEMANDILEITKLSFEESNDINRSIVLGYLMGLNEGIRLEQNLAM